MPPPIITFLCVWVFLTVVAGTILSHLDEGPVSVVKAAFAVLPPAIIVFACFFLK